LRVKGIVALGDDPSRPVVIQGVRHVFHPPLRLPAWLDADHCTRMVFILRDMEPSFVQVLWQTLTALVEPAAARCANPLAPTKGGLLA
jgi:G3E family GTPase